MMTFLREFKAVAVILMVFTLMVLGCENGTAQLLSVTPTTITMGSPDTLLHLKGKNFTSNVQLSWNSGSNLGTVPATVVDASDLTATIPAEALTKTGPLQIFAMQGGTNQTVTQSLTITVSNTQPTLTGMAPLHVLTNAASLTLTLTGTNFNSTSVASIGSTKLATTLVNATTLTAVVPAASYSTAGSASVTVANSGGTPTAAETLVIVSPLTISTTTLPGATLGVSYSATLAAAGGLGPYTWSISSGTLPAGLTLSSIGIISGTPTAAGSSTFTIQVVDSTGSLARKLVK